MLVEIARQRGYTKVSVAVYSMGSSCMCNYFQVLVGDSATRLAVRLLGNIAQGRGASLQYCLHIFLLGICRHKGSRYHLCLTSTVNCDLVVLSKSVFDFREFPSHEVAMHMALNNLKMVTIPSLTALVGCLIFCAEPAG